MWVYDLRFDTPNQSVAPKSIFFYQLLCPNAFVRWPTQYQIRLLLRRCFHLQMAYASSLLRMHVFYHNELLIFLWQMLQITCLKITNFTSCIIDPKWRHTARAHVAPCISEILHRVQKCTWRDAQYWCHFPMRVKARLPTFPTINRRFYWMVLLYHSIRKTW